MDGTLDFDALGGIKSASVVLKNIADSGRTCPSGISQRLEEWINRNVNELISDLSNGLYLCVHFTFKLLHFYNSCICVYISL